jgi:predicted Zn-dependent protease
MNAWKAVLSIAIVVVTLVTAREYFLLPTLSGSQAHATSPRNIVIIPMTGLPHEFVSALEEKLEEQHNTDILVSTAVGKGEQMLLPDGNQYDASFLAGVGLEVVKQLQTENPFVIVLTNEDLNYPRSGVEYVYSAHYGTVSVVSLARANEMKQGLLSRLVASSEESGDVQEAALKHVNRAIGYGVYGDEVSLELVSARHSPVLEPDDVFQVSACYPR